MLEIHKRDIKDVFPPSRIFNANLAPFFNASGSAGYWGDYKFWEPSIGFSVMIVDENHVFTSACIRRSWCTSRATRKPSRRLSPRWRSQK